MIEFAQMLIEELIPAGYNPRVISAEARQGLRRSLDRFGMVEPIVWNQRSARVVGGHQRLSLLQEQGADRVPVVVVDLDDTDEKALNVALNNPHLTGEFTDGLQPLLEEILEADPYLFGAVNLDGLFEDFADEDPPEHDPLNMGDDGTIVLSNRTFVVTQEQDLVIQRAMERVRDIGVFVPEGANSDNGNELASVCAYFLRWADMVLAERDA